MKNSRKLLGLLVGLASLFGILAVGCSDKAEPTKKPTTPQPAPAEAGVYYYDYNGSEYLLSLTDNYMVTLIAGNVIANGKYSRDNNNLTFTYTLEGMGNMSAKINAENSVITLTYNGVTMSFLRRVLYNVTFDSASGSSVASVQVLNGKSFSKPDDPVRAGYTFLGWYKESDYKTPFMFESDIIIADTTLYAQWGQSVLGENVYTVKFDVGNYEGAVSLQPKKTVGGKLYGLTEPQRDGYKFGGWWYSVTGKADELTYRVNADTVYNESTTLYAVWQNTTAGSKVASPLVSVVGNQISWDQVASVSQYKVQVVCNPENPEQTFNPIDRTVSETSTTVAFNVAGTYTVTVTALSSTGAANNSDPTVRTYKYNPLARVSLFEVVSDTLLWNAVDHAQKYIVKVDCGNVLHSHDAVDNGLSTYFNFSNCEMQSGGIKFTVTAKAAGYTSSVSEEFSVERDLAPIAELRYDEATQTVMWQAVPNATNYEITVTCGTAGHTHTQLNLGNVTRYDLKECSVPTSGIKVSVTPRSKGYNSPAATELTVTAAQKSAPATPTDIRIIGTTLSWTAVTGADKYTVRIGDKDIETATNSVDLSKQSISWTKNSDYNIRVRAHKADKVSAWSDAADARYYAMYSTMSYSKNTVSWRLVIGADGYDVRVNEGEITKVTDGTNFARVTLTQAGENKIEVRFYNEEETSDWAPLTVNAYTLTYDARGGMAAAGFSLEQYYAFGDEITFPTVNDITREGYTLGEMYTTPGGAEGNGMRFTDTTYTASGDMVLYASWVSKTYKVTLDYNGKGTGTVTEVTVLFGKPYVLPVPETIIDLTSVFSGWCANAIGTAAMYTDENGNSLGNWSVASDIVLYAKWASVFRFEKSQDSTGYYYTIFAGDGKRDVTTATVPATYQADDDAVAYPVKQIGLKAFDSCTGVQIINLPSTIEVIQPLTFETHSALREINVYQVENGSNVYFSDGGVLYYNNATASSVEVWGVPRAKTGEYTLNNRTTLIPSRAFYYSALDELKIPVSVSYITKNAFEASKIPTITFLSPAANEQSNTLMLEVDALYSASTLETITLPARNLVIWDAAENTAVTNVDFNLHVFRNCSKLANIIVDPDNATFQSIGNVLCSKGVDATILYCPNGRTGTFTIPNGIVKIGSRAFAGCRDIKKIEIPIFVKEIENHAFTGYSVKIGNTTTIVNGCTGLTEVVFLGGEGVPENLVIGDYAFGDNQLSISFFCSSLATLTFMEGSNVVTIGKYAFSRCPITTLKMPDTLGQIKEGAFYGCDKLESVEYAESSKELSVGDLAFANCTSFTTVKLPANITEFNDGVFAGCTSLANIEVDPNNPVLSSLDGVLFNKTQTEILLYPVGKTGNYTIPATVTKIGSGAFSGKENITDITIGKNVTHIGAGAFRRCINLETVTFEPGGEQELVIGTSAFNYCQKLTEFKLPDRVKAIPDRMLMWATHLYEIYIPEGVESIGNYAFFYVGHSSSSSSAPATIDKVTIPASVMTVGIFAFYDCSVREVEFKDKASGDFIVEVPTTDISANTGVGWSDDYVPSEIKAGESRLFYNCSKLEKVTLPKGLKYMPAAMFMSCSKLKEVTIPGTVEKLGSTALRGCTSITSVVFAERELDTQSKPLALELEDGRYQSQTGQYDQEQYYGVFAECTNLTSIVLPEGTTRIGDYAFAKCTNLYKVTIPSTVQNMTKTVDGHTVYLTAIGNGAFAKCSALGSTVNGDLGGVIFTSGGTGEFSLGNKSFENCTSLKTITLPKNLVAVPAVTITQIGSNTTYFVDNDADGVRTGYQSSASGYNYTNASFNGCTNLAEINVEEGGAQYASDDGILYGVDQAGALTKLVYVPLGRTKDVTVPHTVTLVKSFAFLNNTKVKKVTFLSDPPATEEEDSVDALDDDDAVTGLVIGKDILAKEGGPFYNTKVEEVNFPRHLSSISDYAFNKCASLTTVKFADDTDAFTYIGKNSFSDCSALTGIAIPDSVTTIDNNAFINDKKLSTFTIKHNDDFTSDSQLNTIGDKAFSATGLAYVYLPPAKEFNLGAGAFSNCSKLTRVDIPNTIATFDGLFSGSYALSTLNIYSVKDEEGNEVEGTLSSDEGVIYVDGGKTLSYYPVGRTAKKYTIPAGVTKIAASAFLNNLHLEEVVIPNTVAEIGDKAFYGMSKLKKVVFEEDSVEHYVLLTNPMMNGYVGDKFTKNGDEYELDNDNGTYGKLSVPDSLVLGSPDNSYNEPTKSPTSPFVAGSIFAYDYNLEVVNFPTRLSAIAGYSFYYCTKLTTVTFDKNCQLGVISTALFSNTSLQYGGTREDIEKNPENPFTFPSDITRINDGRSDATNPLGKLTKLIIPEKVAYIGQYALNFCDYLEEVEFKGNGDVAFGTGTSSIGYTFDGCKRLSKVTLPAGLTSIPKYMFRNCVELTEIILPNGYYDAAQSKTVGGIATIGQSAFEGCVNLAKITYDKTITQYDLYLSSKITKLESGAFAGTAITSAYIPWGFTSTSGLSTIFGTSQTTDATTSTSVVLCKNLKKVEFGPVSSSAAQTSLPAMFMQLPALEEVILPTSKLTTISAGAFAYSGLKKITIPKNITTINAGAFTGCKRLEKVDLETGETVLVLAPGTANVDAFSSYSKNGVFAFAGANNGRAAAKEAADQSNDQKVKDDYAANFVIDLSGRKVQDKTSSGYIVGIAKWMFSGLQNLDVKLPTETVTIATLSFQSAAIDKVIIPAKTTTIQIAAFALSKIKEIEFAAATTAVSIAAGTGTSTDTDANRAKLGAFAFSSELTKVDMSKRNITTIPNYAFYECPNISMILWSEKTPADDDPSVTYTTTIGEFAFQSSFNIESLNLPKGITSIGQRGFGYTNIGTIILPNTLTSLGRSAFYESSVTRVEFEAGSTIESFATDNSGTAWTFGYCRSLTSIVLPESLNTIGGYAFYTSGLTSVTIPGSVTSIGNNAFSSCASLASVNIAKSVTSIGSNAFANCSLLATVTFEKGEDGSCALTTLGASAFNRSGLTSISIPKSVTTIGDSAFANCTNLATVTFEKGEDGTCALTTLDGSAFNHTGLTSISIPKSVTSLGSYIFGGCADLTSVTFEKDESGVCALTEIGVSAFNTTGLTTVEIPKSVKTIGNYAFGNCADLATVTFEKGEDGTCALTSIGAGAFNRTAISSIEIPKSVTSMGDNPFYYCSKLTSVTVEDGNSTFIAKDNVVYNSDESILLIYAGGLEGEFAIPDTVVEIAAYAFAGSKFSGEININREGFTIGNSAFEATGVTSVTLANGAILGTNAFYRCEDLTSVTMGNNAVIGSSAFESTGVTSVTLGKGATLGSYAFSECEDLTFVTLGDNAVIGSMAFENTVSLTSFVIPVGATVDITAFSGSGVIFTEEMLKDDTSLKYDSLNAELDGTLEFATVSAAVTALKNNEELHNVRLAEGITTIDNNAFKDIANLEKVVLPSTLTTIGTYAFSNTSLKEIFIPKSVTAIRYYAFYANKELTKVEFEEGSALVQFYGSSTSTAGSTKVYTFAECPKLETVILPGSLQKIPYYIFENDVALTSITVPATVTEIGQYAFNGCTLLDTVEFAKNDDGTTALTSITTYAFNNTKLTAVSIPASVTTIATYAFATSTLNSVKFEKNAEGNTAIATLGGFAGTSITSIVIPKTVVTVSANAFENCTLLTTIEFERDENGRCAFAAIGNNAFAGTAITSISLPATYTGCTTATGSTAADKVFQNCTSLTSVTFEKNADGTRVGMRIGKNAFEGTAITSITIPYTIAGLGDNAFLNCTQLTTVTFEKDDDGNASNNFWLYPVFNGCTSLKHIVIPASIKLYSSVLSCFSADCVVYFESAPGPSTQSTLLQNKWLDGCVAKIVWNWSEDMGFLNENGEFENQTESD
ncbi:MAG: leucine-rich repeat protein [Clostridiales bacterium]|nr:leucine-rich repeat protein [Clostridiales bacterium]